MTVQNQGFMAGCWVLHPVLDVPDSFPPAVMFAIRDADPLPSYKGRLQSLSEMQRHMKFGASASVAPEAMRQGLLYVAWDAGFRDISGDKIGILFRSPAPYAMAIQSNEPAGRKWLVSRAVQLGEKVVCWCVPFEVRQGEQTQVTLTEANMTNLAMA